MVEKDIFADKKKKYIYYGEMLAKGFQDGLNHTPSDAEIEWLQKRCEAMGVLTKNELGIKSPPSFLDKKFHIK